MNKALMILAIVCTSAISQAMIAPWYMQLRLIDAAIEAVAEHLNIDDTDEANIHLINISSGPQQVSVGMSGELCQVEVVARPLPDGAVGVPGLDGKVLSCVPTHGRHRTATYEKISAKLDKAAKLAKIVEKVEVDSRGKIKLKIKK